jgi:hypothetical protein
MITINASSGIHTIQNNPLQFYPNPVLNTLHFNNTAFENKVCRIFDMTGRMVLEQLIPSGLKIECDKLTKGLYTIVIFGDTVYTEQMMKD